MWGLCKFSTSEQISSFSWKAIDDLDDLGMTALHWAVITGVCVIVEALLDAGAHVDSLNNGLCSPLLISSITGNADIPT